MMSEILVEVLSSYHRSFTCVCFVNNLLKYCVLALAFYEP